MLFRHPIMFHPPPEALGKATCDNLPHNKSKSGCTNRMLVVSRQISSSSSNGRWDRMVLKKKSLTGNPHTSVFKGMWKGWDKTVRTISQMVCRNTAIFWTKIYVTQSNINVPPPV